MTNISELQTRLRQKSPLIHCITNPISIQLCANAILAVGARPMMAEHPAEVWEITPTAGALLLNLGNITDVRMQSMSCAAQNAAERQIPVVLDAVGVACSHLRREFAGRLMQHGSPAVLKGNYSEIQALYHGDYHACGVDAERTLPAAAVEQSAAALARQLHTVVLASGPVDLVTDGARLMRIKNGTPQLGAVTGTGCMLGALTAALLAVCPGWDAAVTACVVQGVCGQLAETPLGSGSFQQNLMDALSTVTEECILPWRNMEEIILETF